MASGARTLKYNGRVISIDEAAKALGEEASIFFIACYPRKGGGFRDDDQIVAICTANACRTVAESRSYETIEQLSKAARIFARYAGYVLIDEKFIEGVRKRVMNSKRWKNEEEFARKSKKPKRFDRMQRDLESTFQPMVQRGNFTRFASFCKKWKMRVRLTGTPSRGVDDDIVDKYKLLALAKDKSKEKKYITAQALEKYVARIIKRWGAFGSMFFQAGKSIHPKLRRLHTSGAPVQRKFAPKKYERASIKVSGNQKDGNVEIVIIVDSDIVDKLPVTSRAVNSMCASAAEFWAKKAETALALKLAGIEL